MLKQGVRKSELARRLNWHLPQVDRLLDLTHSSGLEQLEKAIGVLGKRAEFSTF
jgi:antitoxin HicB